MHRRVFLMVVFGLLVVDSAAGQSRILTAGDDYEVFPDVVYRAVDSWEGRLDIYVAAGDASRTPLLVWFHGGGWTRGSKEAEFLYVLPYLARGWSIVNVEYRLASVAPAPAAVEDSACALRWIAAHADEYGLNARLLVVSGVSAGGHLALMASLLPHDSPLFESCAEENPATVAAVVNWFGPSDVAALVAGDAPFGQALEWMANRGSAAALQVSPLSYIRPQRPPVITLHGSLDELIPFDQSVRLHAELSKVGVPNRLVAVRNRGHGFFGPRATAGAYRAIWKFLRDQKIPTRGPEPDEPSP